MLMSSFLDGGIRIADLISNLGLDGVGVTSTYSFWVYEPERAMPCFMQICNALILTCGLACCHPQGLPPPSQDPEVFSADSHFHRQYFMENNDSKDNRDNNFDLTLPSLLLACTYGNSLLCLKTC